MKINFSHCVLFISLIFLLNQSVLLSEPENQAKLFQFILEPDDVLVVNKYQDIQISEGSQVTTKEEKNKITLKVNSKQNNVSQLEGNFITYSRSPRQTGDFRLENTFHSAFSIEKSGLYTVPESFIMPNLRSLPSFPDRALKAGETWIMPAEETLDIAKEKIYIPLNVYYRYSGSGVYKDSNGKEQNAERIEYRYTVDKKINETRTGLTRITGFSADILFFDTEQGIPVFDTNRLVYHFHMSDGRILHYSFRIDSWYRKIKHLKESEKTEITEKIEKDLKEDKDIKIRKSDDGIVLDMNAVFFETDSSNLKDDAKQKLKTISEILKKYPEREIRISGHTDSTGSSAYNKKLSEQRAKSVLNELIKGDISQKRMSYRGYGESKPLESNATEEGRSKNRRVEILIVTE